MFTETPCPFCSPADEAIVFRNLLCYARHDRFPISEGHLLIVPFRHEADFFSLTPDERAAALDWSGRPDSSWTPSSTQMVIMSA